MTDSFVEMVIRQLWQISILFVILASAGYFLRERKPHLLLLLWVLFFVKCLVPPVVQSPVSPMALLTPSAVDSATRSGSEESANALAQPYLTTDNEITNSHSAISTLSATPELATSSLTPQSLTRVTTLLWVTGSGLVLIGFLANYCIVRRQIFRHAVVRDDLSGVKSARNILNSLCKQIGMPSRQVRLLVSNDSMGPLVFGFFRPTIVLPIEMVESNVSLRPIIGHELCHVWRRDHLLGCLQVTVQVVFWFHPFVWMASRKINRLCEVCCDDDTVRIFDLNSKQYAGGLLDVLAMQRVVKAVHLAPGIRPVEVTKQRIKQIVSKQGPKTRQSQVFVVCLFLCLALPALGSQSRNGGLESEDEKASIEIARLPVGSTEIAQRRTEMDFLLGVWKVRDMSGNPVGESTFAYEKSGKMIREDWVGNHGMSAQGITFFDPNENCWKMTWVDSSGVIMESAGHWSGKTLTLLGDMTSKDGRRTKAESKLTRQDSNSLSLKLRVEIDGQFRTVSQSSYQRRPETSENH